MFWCLRNALGVVFWVMLLLMLLSSSSISASRSGGRHPRPRCLCFFSSNSFSKTCACLLYDCSEPQARSTRSSSSIVRNFFSDTALITLCYIFALAKHFTATIRNGELCVWILKSTTGEIRSWWWMKPNGKAFCGNELGRTCDFSRKLNSGANTLRFHVHCKQVRTIICIERVECLETRRNVIMYVAYAEGWIGNIMSSRERDYGNDDDRTWRLSSFRSTCYGGSGQFSLLWENV